MSVFKNKKIISFLLLSVIFILFFSVFSQTKAQGYPPPENWWIEYKDASNVHTVGGNFISENACTTWWTQNNYYPVPLTLVKGCFQSTTRPAITPVVCTWPLVLDTTTDTCVNPTLTCTLPQVLDTTTNTCVTPTVNTDTTYTLLAPLPFMGLDGTDPKIDTLYNKDTNPCPFGKYLNVLIKLFLGIAGVLAVIMIVWGGIQYMTSELASSKEEGKKSITNAILGLLLALGAWLILNTINPDLLNVCLNLPPVEITIIENFDISGDSTFDGNPIKVNFNKEAYPAAKIASQKTGVDVALILAIFQQETGGGRNTGRCRWNQDAAHMYEEDKIALQTIVDELGKNIEDTPVSCALLKNDGSYNGHGGAIGLTQFRPATWKENRNGARTHLGHMPDPWNPADALMMTAVYLKRMGGVTNQKEAACKYFGGPGVGCSTNADIDNYGNSVMGKKVSIQQQIDEAIKKGEISP